MTMEARARASLGGLHAGDAFGQQFFAPTAEIEAWLPRRELPPPIWSYTDDSAQAAVLFRHLVRNGRVLQDALAIELAEEHHRDPMRGYGAGARQMLEDVHSGAPWREVARRAFAGMGSMGNGAAMRVAPLGAWFAGDLDVVVEQAALSAEVTHANVNAVAGAVAVAVAAACFAIGQDVWTAVLDRTPTSLTKDMLHRAAGLADGCSVEHAAAVLGTGVQVCAHDTVPFALWTAVRFRSSYEECLWATVSGGGDRDTTCAIAGGIVAAGPRVRVPQAWARRVEALR